MTLIVLAAAAGLLGVKTGTATTSGDGYEMELEYAAVARAGLDVPFDVKLTHPDGLRHLHPGFQPGRLGRETHDCRSFVDPGCAGLTVFDHDLRPRPDRRLGNGRARENIYVGSRIITKPDPQDVITLADAVQILTPTLAATPQS